MKQKILKVDEINNEEAWYQDSKVITQWGYKKLVIVMEYKFRQMKDGRKV